MKCSHSFTIDIPKRLKELDPANAKAFCAFDDIASAQLFAMVFKEGIRYNVTSKCWYVYDGIRWKPDIGDIVVEQYAKQLARSLWAYSADYHDQKEFREYVCHFQERRRRRTMIDDARDLLHVEQTDFDADPDLLNCQNCVLNLKKHKRIEHSPDLLLSKVCNADYDPEADSTVFTNFIDQVMQGDRAKVEYLQTLFGYALTGTNEREECFMLYGSTTRNGKSTLLNTIRHLFGGYGASVQPETLAMQKNRDGRTASGDIARLNGCRFLQMSEPPKRMKIDVALLKTLIGRDTITARHLYEREFEFIPCFKLFINTNFLPVVLDDTLFASGRVKVITFDRHFDEKDQDTSLKDRLLLPENLSALLNWMLTGLKRYHANGNTIAMPDAVRDATNDYRTKSDKLQNFIDECLTENPYSTITAKEAYLTFSKWCQSNGYGVENKANFFDELRAKGLLSGTGTINGNTVKNVIKGYSIDTDIRVYDDFDEVFE